MTIWYGMEENKVEFKEKIGLVFELYEKYERLVQPYKSQAVCEKGCASCCIDVGSVGATTLEGLIIAEYAPLVVDDCIPLKNVMVEGLWFTDKPLSWVRRLRRNCRN